MSTDDEVPSLKQFTLDVSKDEEGDAEIGRNIARLRKERGLSQQALADRMRAAGRDHWRQNTVSRIETGRQSLGSADMEPLGAIVGDFLAGTAMGKGLREAMRGFETLVLNHRLARLESSLQDALDGVQELRIVYDLEYREANPELRKLLLEEHGDGEHPEA